MPMVPETVIAMLACARIGAIHSVVFGGFASPELASRITDARPQAILTASCGIEIDREVPYKPLHPSLPLTLTCHVAVGVRPPYTIPSAFSPDTTRSALPA
jgi:acyl-coenzyme A synthetase/AMP-(fatty) acid ligase